MHRNGGQARLKVHAMAVDESGGVAPSDEWLAPVIIHHTLRVTTYSSHGLSS